MSYPNRTLCDVLEEMRKSLETSNFSYLGGLIEEVQSIGNRMEASLHDSNDHKRLLKDIKRLKKKREELAIGTDEEEHY